MKTIPGRIFAVLLVVSLSFSSLVILNVKANFIPPPETLITVTITSPQNNEKIQTDQFKLKYTVTNIPQETITSKTNSITFSTRVNLDGKWIIDPYSFKPTISEDLSFNHTININKVTDGNHSIRIIVYCKRSIDGIENSILALQGSSQATYFSTLKTKPTSDPTIEPTSSPSTEQALQLPSKLEIIIVAIAVLLSFGLFATIVKRRSKPK